MLSFGCSRRLACVGSKERAGNISLINEIEDFYVRTKEESTVSHTKL